MPRCPRSRRYAGAAGTGRILFTLNAVIIRSFLHAHQGQAIDHLFSFSFFVVELNKLGKRMAPRTPLEVNTASLLRLVKEEASYHKEYQQQSERIARLEGANGAADEDGNRPYVLRQEVSEPYYTTAFRVYILNNFSGKHSRRPKMSCPR